MKLRFTKMHGAGNDFIVVDAISQHIDLEPKQWARLADRRFGIGADQILVVEASPGAGIDFRYRIFNSDGGEVEQCGNGARAFVKFVTDKGLTSKRAIRVQTMNGVIEPLELGGVQSSLIWPEPSSVAPRLLGRPGGVMCGVAVAGADGGPVPATLVAVTLKV